MSMMSRVAPPEEPTADHSGERALAAAVLHLAISDAMDVPVLIGGVGRAHHRVRCAVEQSRAREFCTAESGTWALSRQLWCDRAGIDPVAFREAMVRKLGECT